MRLRIGGVSALVVLLCAAAGSARAVSGGTVEVGGGLVPTSVPSVLPSALPQIVNGLASAVPSPVQSTIDTLTEILPSPLKSLLPQLTQVLPGAGGVTGGGPIGTTGGASAVAGGGAGKTPPAAGDAHVLPHASLPSVSTGSVRLAPNGGAADRALRLAGPMSMPVAAAVLALFGIGVFARSRSSFEVLETEKEAVGGWTVIRL